MKVRNSPIRGSTTLVNALMAMPPPPAPPMYGPAPMPEAPGTGNVRTGLLVAGIGLILGAFLGFLFGFIGPLIVLIGGALMMVGAGKSYRSAKGTATAGFALVLVGFVLNILAWVMTPALLIVGTPTVDYLNTLATGLLISFLATLIFWIGVLVMPLKLMTGSAKGLAIAGAVLGIVGALLVFVMVYLAVAAILAAATGGSVPDLNTFLAAVAGLIIGGLMGLIGGILAGVGYIIGRGKLVAPS